jgi:arylformamidase
VAGQATVRINKRIEAFKMLNRRNFIALSAGTLGMGGLAFRAAAKVIEPESPVFLGYSQEQLDRVFDQSAWAPRMKELEEGLASASAAVRRQTPPRTERYGESEAEVLDIFAPPGARNAPVMVFVHGGAWIRSTKDDASFPAPIFNGRGAIYIAVNYASLTSVRMPEMVEQCRRAIGWVIRNATNIGANPQQVFLSGHSAGAHLSGCMLTTDWGARGMTANPIRGALLLSGLYELHPVVLSSRRAYVHLTEDEVNDLSPIRHLHRVKPPITIISADEDSPEFQRQSKVFAAALDAMGLLATHEILFNANHFEEVQQLGQAGSAPARHALQIMGL